MDRPEAQSTGQAVEYLRRSVERDKSADKDKGAGQRAANAEQAARDGVTITRTFDGDWGISGGRGKRGKRVAMADLIEAIRAGEVSRLYCHTTDRLARDLEYGMALWNACKDAGAVIRPGSQTFDPREPGYLTLWGVLLAQAEEDLDRMTRKNQDTQDFGRDHAATCTLPGRPHRGRCHLIGCEDTTHCKLAHKRGRVPYSPEITAQVLAAFDEAGTFLGACKALTTAGVPSMFGGKPNPRGNGSSYGWNVRTVARIIRRERPGMPSKARQGDRGPAHRHVLSGLLTCACGATLSSMPRPGGHQVGYWCRKAHSDPGHSRPYVVSERYLVPWVRAEVEHLELPVDAVQMGREATAERADLTAQRERLALGYARGGLTQATYEAEDGALVALLAALGDTEEAAAVSPIRPEEWDTWTPADLNAYIRAILASVTLGPDMRPRSAKWRNESLRRP